MLRLFLLALLLFAAGCSEKTAASSLSLERNDRAIGGHLPPEHEIKVRTRTGEHVVSPAAWFAVLGPEDAVAWVGPEGLHLWQNGRSRWIAAATPRGLGAGPSGVAFTSAAEMGAGSGVSFMTWSGEVRELIPAPESLPGSAGYHKPAVSPDGRYVVAFGDLTPRPSIHRVELSTGTVVQLVEDAPSSVGPPQWLGDLLVWSTGDGRAALHVESGEVSVTEGAQR